MRKLYGAIGSLKQFPQRGRPGREDGTRELFFPPTPYVAVYRVRAQAIEIMRIYHAAQDRPSVGILPQLRAMGGCKPRQVWKEATVVA